MSASKTAHFSLDPPPGFRAFDPYTAFTVYHRRLPHWRQDGATYFVTFRLADSLPREKIDLLASLKREWETTLAARAEAEQWDASDKQRAWDDLSRQTFATVESWLDRSAGKCLLGDRENQILARDAFDHADRIDCRIGAGVIMPNHVHLLIQPFEGRSLEEILQSRKRRIAREINSRTGSAGSLWQEESFDRIVRDSGHLWRCLQYVGRNLAKAGLVGNETTRWVHDEWAEAGWNFAEEEP